HADVAQVSHFGQRVAHLHVISRADRQRVKRSISRSSHGRRPHFFFECLHLLLGLTHAQASAFNSCSRALRKGCLLLLQGLKIRACFRQCRLILRELVLRGCLFCDKLRERLLRALEVCDGHLGLLQIALELCNLVGRPSCSRVLQIRSCCQQIRARLRQLSSHIGCIKRQNQLPAMHSLPFDCQHFFDKRRKLSAGHRRGDRLHLSVAGN